ncbi:MAG: ABC transporter ATP-binding protein [Bacteroidales bacterium]|nr:ABC transporter ATP-binding protein [Bacteroidales bacterium]
MHEIAVDIKNIRKSYSGTRVLNNISLQIFQGELFGFIGPDGAGKTSLFHILTSLLLPDNGSAVVAGYDTVKDYAQIRRIVGYMPGKFSLYQDITVEENLKFFAGIFKTTIHENYALYKDIYGQIEPFRKRKAGQLSGGMKQKLALSCALVHKPQLLFLDEPTTGVDAVSRTEFWEMLKKLRDQGITIIVSTPYMDEAALCDRVALMDRGQLMAVDAPANIIRAFGQPLFAVKSDKMFPLPQALAVIEQTKTVYRSGEFVHYLNNQADFDPARIEDQLLKLGHAGITIRRIEPTIEDCFMLLMQNPLEVETN